MSDTEYNEYAEELKQKRICRFCLSQEEPLSNIYSNENRKNSRAPLPLQIMACVSIEVFTNDEMPDTICQPCRLLMDYCYRFKQMCKKADTVLKQFPLTGAWPNKLIHPKIPDEILQKVTNASPPQASSAVKRKREAEQTPSVSQKRKQILQFVKLEQPCVEDNSFDLEIEPEPERPPPKVLNKNIVRILNKQAPNKDVEPILKWPVLQTNEAGHIEFVSEILQPSDKPEEEIDPLKNAYPVKTNVFPCEYCERSFPLRQLLDIHAANHVRDRKFSCEVCQKGFFSKYDLGKHSLIHTGEKPFQCVVCSKAFSRSTLLRRHEKVHSDQPKFLCAHCERPFLSREEWERHTTNHLKNRPYVCKICNKSFAFKQGLERHEVVHSTEQPYKCEHCDQGFSTQGKLARHLTAHAGSRPYPCRICDKSYLLSHHLTRHMRSHKEAGIGSYKCDECNSMFTNREGLIYHSAVHATESLTCPLCKEQFDTVDDVTIHIKAHAENDQYACEFCDSIFLTEEKLQEHSDSQHVDEIQIYDNDGHMRQIKKESNTEFSDNTDAVEIQQFIVTEDGTVNALPDNDLSHSNAEPIDENEDFVLPIQEQNLDCSPEDPEQFEEQPVEAKVNVKRYSRRSNATQPKAETFRASDSTPKSNQPKRTPSPKRVVRYIERTVTKVATSTPSAQSKRSPAAAAKTNPSNDNKLKRLILTSSAKATSTQAPPAKTTVSPANTKLTTITRSGISKGTSQASTSTQAGKVKRNELINMQIGNKVVKVQQIRMTKAEVEAMAKEGKIELKGTQIILKPKSSLKKGN